MAYENVSSSIDEKRLQVCNHPELFERSDVVSPFSFCTFGHLRNLLCEGELLECPYSTQNPIKLTIPELFFLDGGLLDVPGETSRVRLDKHWLENVMSVWSTEFIDLSLRKSGACTVTWL